MLLLLAACATPPAPAPVPSPVPAPVPASVPAPPAGTIGGDPILDHPVVLGGIAESAVQAGLKPHEAQIHQCFADGARARPGLGGKVLVKFAIGSDGGVSAVSTRATSLRDPSTEACIQAEVAKATFAGLASGAKAIVLYPFAFP